MRILYYDWDEVNGEDCRDAMRCLGYQVDSFKMEMKGYEITPEIESTINELFKKNTNGKPYYDLLFSFDFFPNLSEVCQKNGMPYVSWVFDCPHYTLYSKNINNPVNHIYIFDKVLYREMLENGYRTVYYSPLGLNVERLANICNKLDHENECDIIYEHDVSFVGSLYDNEYNLYDRVKYLPEKLKSYIDGVIRAQEQVFGVDFFSDKYIVTKEIVQELRKYITFENTGNYDFNYEIIILNILRKKVTENERRRILYEMGKSFDIALYSNPYSKMIQGVSFQGIIDYMNGMPRVFHRSKVNLNITLRSVRSGVPLRVLDILGAGGFLITNYQEEIASYFVDGQDLIIAYTPEDMVEKTAYYLANDEERKAIAQNGQKKAFEEFSYTKLLSKILGSIQG